MPGLNLYSEDEFSSSGKKQKAGKGPKLILGAIVLVLVPIVGTSLASNVTVNAGNITFGQGYSAAVACSGTVNISPATVYQSSAFNVQTLTVTNINTVQTSGGVGCGGRTLVISAIDSTTGTALSGGSVTFTLPTASGAATSLSGASAFNSAATNPDTLIIRVSSAFLATNVGGFTIQEQ
jgi:hypothetical protein